MKKILFVINTLGGAGAEKALIELLFSQKKGKKFLTERYGGVSGFGERCSEIYRFFSEIPLLC